jgi:protein gp37
MAENSNIEWCDHTFNPWIGCTKVGPGCDHCYAEALMDKRMHQVSWGSGAQRKRTSPANWKMPQRWNNQHEAFQSLHGRRQRVFCASLADVFDNEVNREWRDDLATLIASTPNLDWLLVTKRIGNAGAMLGEMFLDGPPDNIWIGATVVNQTEADRDVPKLLATPARVRFLSIEPMLGRIRIEPATDKSDVPGTVDWVIVGGESGPQARPMHPDWAREVRDECEAFGVPFLFKQWGEHLGGELCPNPAYPGDPGAWRLDPAGRRWHDPYEAAKPRSEWAPITFMQVGKKAAGRLLDGVEHNGFPEVRHG